MFACSGAWRYAHKFRIADAGKVGSVGALLVLEDCVTAMSAGDGRELWTLQPNGQLVSSVGRTCAGVQEDEAVLLMDCDAALRFNDGRSQWEMLGNGQLKSARAGDYCLSQVGAASGLVNVAANAAAAATSTVTSAHGVFLAAGFVVRRSCLERRASLLLSCSQVH